jgi:hypothetical protein
LGGKAGAWRGKPSRGYLKRLAAPAGRGVLRAQHIEWAAEARRIPYLVALDTHLYARSLRVELQAPRAVANPRVIDGQKRAE